MTRTASPSRSSSRFSRTGTPASARSRAGRQRTAASSRYGLTGGWMQRRPQPKSAPKRALESVASALPGIGKSKSGRSSSRKRTQGGKAGGFALASAAAGLAYRNRSKLMSMLSKKGSSDNAHAETAPVEAGTRATSGPVDPVRTGDIAPTDPGNRPDMR